MGLDWLMEKEKLEDLCFEKKGESYVREDNNIFYVYDLSTYGHDLYRFKKMYRTGDEKEAFDYDYLLKEYQEEMKDGI